MFEKTADPFRGYHLVVYACPLEGEDGRFVGYYKICREPAPSYFEADGCVVKGTAHQAHEDPEAAMQQAIEMGRLRIHEVVNQDLMRAYARTWPVALSATPA